MSEPSFTVVIPSYRRPEPLRACLKSLTRQTLDRERFEVIVVDDGSPEPLADAVSDLTTHLCSTVIRQSNRGPAAARNRGVAEARGRLLAFTDDDCRPEPQWLEAMLGPLEARSNVLVGGRTLNALVSNPFAAASQLLLDYLYDDLRRPPEPTPFFASNNLALPIELFRALNGFDETFPQAAGEDRDFCDRAHHRGVELVYQPEAVVRHAHAMSFAGFWRQHYAYGRGARRFHRRRGERGLRFPRPRVSFYFGLLTYPWRTRSPAMKDHSRWMLASLLTTSQIANALGFLHPEAP